MTAYLRALPSKLRSPAAVVLGLQQRDKRENLHLLLLLQGFPSSTPNRRRGSSASSSSPVASQMEQPPPSPTVVPVLVRQRRQGLGHPPVCATMLRAAIGMSPGKATGGSVEVCHGRQLTARNGAPTASKQKGTTFTASSPPPPAFVAPAAPFTTTCPCVPCPSITHHHRLYVDIDSAQEVFDRMAMSASAP